MMFRTAVVFAILSNGLLCGQEDLLEIGKQHAKAYSLEAEFGLVEYRMIAEITAETAPDAPLFFKSKARMEVLETDEFMVTKFDCYPKIMSDDRPPVKGGGQKNNGPFGRMEHWERMTIDGRALDLCDFQGRRKVPKWSEPVTPFTFRISTVCMKPFDWPLHSPSSFDEGLGVPDLYKYMFGVDRNCISATRPAGEGSLLETHWIKPSPAVQFVNKVTFREDLPVSSELYAFRKPMDLNKYDVKDAMRLIKTETTWGKCGETPVPRTVVSNAYGMQGLLLIAKLDIYSTGDELFEKKKKEYLALAASIDKKK